MSGRGALCDSFAVYMRADSAMNRQRKEKEKTKPKMARGHDSPGLELNVLLTHFLLSLTPVSLFLSTSFYLLLSFLARCETKERIEKQEAKRDEKGSLENCLNRVQMPASRVRLFLEFHVI